MASGFHAQTMMRDGASEARESTTAAAAMASASNAIIAALTAVSPGAAIPIAANTSCAAGGEMGGDRSARHASHHDRHGAELHQRGHTEQGDEQGLPGGRANRDGAWNMQRECAE